MTIETALDFVRECCGYPQAEISVEFARQRKVWLDMKQRPIRTFAHTSPQAVIKYARAWANRRGESFDLTYSPKQRGWGCDCAGIDDFDDDFCEVIMRTLVKAERKINAA